jgi:hypothetical protein
LNGAQSRYKRSPSSLFAAVRTAYPSFFKDFLKKFNKDASLSTTSADLLEAFMLLVGGEGGSGGSGGLGISHCGLVSMRENKCAIGFLLRF